MPLAKLSLTTLGLAACCGLGVVASPAWGQQETTPAIADSPTAQALYEDALVQRTDNPAEAARLARRLLDEYRDKVLRTVLRTGPEGDGRFVAVADEVERFLLANATVLERFRDNESRAAERMLEEQGPEPTAARRRLTRAGLVASLSLAERALAADRPTEARAILSRVSKHPDLTGRERVAFTALQAFAMRRLGLDALEAALPLEQLSRTADLPPDELREVRLALEQVKRTAVQPSASFARTPLATGTQTQPPDSSWREIWTVDLDATLFRRLFDGPVASLSPRAVERARSDASWLVAAPTVVGQTIYLSEGQRVRAFDADSRDTRWTRSLSSMGIERDIGGVGDLSALAVDDGALVALEGHAFANARSGPARIWCLDPRDGTPLWTVDLDGHEGRADFESLFPVGTPILLPDSVIVSARKSTQRLEQVDWLISLDRRDGSVRWATTIAGAPGTRVVAGRRQAGLVLDGDAVVVSTPLGATACVRANDGAIEWLRRVPVPLRDPRLGSEPWELCTPVVAGGRVIVLSPDGDSVEALDRVSGMLLEARPVGPETAWGDPRYLIAASARLDGSGNAVPVVLGVGGDIVAFDARDLSKPLWRFTEALRGVEPARSGMDNRSGIRGRVSVAGDAVLVPGLDEFVVLDLATGAIRARIGGQRPGNAVLADDRIVTAGDDALRVLMAPERAENILRARLASSPDDPATALALVELARATQRPNLALEAARVAEAALSRGHGSEMVREALLGQLVELASSVPDAGAEAHELAARIADTPRLRVRQMLAYGEFFRLTGRAREAIEVWSKLSSDPVLGPELVEEEGIARATRGEALRRIARIASRDVEITEQLDREAAEELREFQASNPAAAGLVAFAHANPRTRAATEAVLAASAELGPVKASHALGAVLGDLLVPPARVDLVDDVVGALARLSEGTTTERRVRIRTAELLVASGVSRAELAERGGNLARVGTTAKLGRDLRGRLARLSGSAYLSRKTDLALIVADGALQRLSLDSLDSLWRLRLDDRDPLVLHAGDRIVVWQALAGGSENALVVNAATGAVELSTGRSDEIWTTAQRAAGAERPEVTTTPDGGAFIATQVLPLCDGESLILVRRNGDAARFAVDQAGQQPTLARELLWQVYAASINDGLVTIAGRGGSAVDPRPVVKVLDARTLEERCSFEPSSREDIRWAFATALGEVFLGTSSGVERWTIGADGKTIPMLVTRASECMDALGPNLLGASLVVLDRNDRPLRLPIYEGGVGSFELPESTDFGSPSLRSLVPVREGLMIHAENRVILRGPTGEVLGMDLIAGELNFAFALPAEPGVFVLNGLGGRQVLGAAAGTFRVDFPYVAQLLSPKFGLRMSGEPFEISSPSQRADRALVVDGWMLLSSSQGITGVSLPTANPAAPAP